MASPQLEDGFIRVSREVKEALCRFRIPGEARQVFDFIILKTWGWQKKSDVIPLSQFVLGTGLKKNNVIRARQKLLDMKLIVIKKENAELINYSINKDFDSWKSLSKKRTLSKAIKNVIQKENLSFSKAIPSKETASKETTKESAGARKILSVADLIAEGVDSNHAGDWLRSRVRAPLTQTAWAAIKREAAKAGTTAADAVRIMAESGWRGFKADWVQGRDSWVKVAPRVASCSIPGCTRPKSVGCDGKNYCNEHFETRFQPVQNSPPPMLPVFGTMKK